jgi:hypothetical protein
LAAEMMVKDVLDGAMTEDTEGGAAEAGDSAEPGAGDGDGDGGDSQLASELEPEPEPEPALSAP